LLKNFGKTLKEMPTLAKMVVVGSVGLIVIGSSISSQTNIGFGLKVIYSQYSGNEVNINTENDKQQLMAFDITSGKYKTKKYYVVSGDNNEIEINQIGSWLNLMTDKIKLSTKITNQEKEIFIERLPLLVKLGFKSEENLPLPKDIKDIINIDVENDIPIITYLDNNNHINFKNISRLGILADANAKYITQEQAKNLGISLDNDISNGGFKLNTRMLSKFDEDNYDTYVLPKDFKNIISITKNKNEKLISYKTINGSLKIFKQDDINTLNTNYTIVDKNGHDLFNKSNNISKSKSINVDLFNKIVDNSNETNILKINVDREDISSIESIDQNGGTLYISYIPSKSIDTNQRIKVEGIGMTMGVFNPKFILTNNTLKTNNNQSIQR